MSRFWSVVVSILCIAGLIGLIVGPKPPPHNRGAVYVVIRGSTEQQTETKAPRGDWLLVRRIPRPQAGD